MRPSRVALAGAGLLAPLSGGRRPRAGARRTEADCNEVTAQDADESTVAPTGPACRSRRWASTGHGPGWRRRGKRAGRRGRGRGDRLRCRPPGAGIAVVGHVPAGDEGRAGVLPRHRGGRADRRASREPDGNPVGIAPAAQILDVQVYDDPPPPRRPGSTSRRSRPRTSCDGPGRGDRGPAAGAQHQGRHHRAAAAARRRRSASGSSGCGTWVIVVVAPTRQPARHGRRLPGLIGEEFAEGHRPARTPRPDPPGGLPERAGRERHDDRARRGASSPPVRPGELEDRHRRAHRRRRVVLAAAAAPACSTTRRRRGPRPRSAACSRCCQSAYDDNPIQVVDPGSATRPTAVPTCPTPWSAPARCRRSRR